MSYRDDPEWQLRALRNDIGITLITLRNVAIIVVRGPFALCAWAARKVWA